MTEERIDEGIERYATSDAFTGAEKAALGYAERMATAPETIDEAFYEDLARHYSVEEIVELGAFIGFNVGFHVFFGTLDFYPMFTPDGRLVSQEESRRVYGDKPVSLLSGADAPANPEAAE
ncbi:MAG TPA: hypothetical protein QF804_00050 [Rhodospirillales bacterium]|nr:hypothetical protein [Rhodospirillales bacterium]